MYPWYRVVRHLTAHHILQLGVVSDLSLYNRMDVASGHIESYY